MEKVFLLILICRGLYCQPCGDPSICSCRENLGFIICNGIEKLPLFNRSNIWNIDMLDIVNTSLYKLPDLDDWTNLAMLTVMGNP